MSRSDAIAVLALAVLLAGAGRARAAPPAQPIPFSHRVHAGVNQIGCLGCHTYAERSPVAGIPSMARCFGCHKFVAKDKPDVQAVVQAYQDGKVLEWNRVHRVPDHVYFTHERHLAAGLRCQQCHGEVEKMDVVVRVSSLTMGWCLDCHKKRNASTNCLTCHK